MKTPTWFTSWHFDILSSFITLIVVPLLIFVLLIIKKPLFAGTKYILLGAIYYISARLNKAAAARLSLRRYARVHLAGSSRYLFVPAAQDIHLEIDKIFVPLVLERAGIQTGYNHTNFLEAGHRIIIIGDPGSGKSSIAQRVFRDECRKAQDTPRKARFPVLLELRNVPFPTRGAEAHLGDWLFDYLVREISRTEAYDIVGCFQAYTRTIGVLVILDGLDEIATRHYSRASSAINQLAERLQRIGPHNVVIITTRIQFHRQVREAFVATFPVVLSIRRFTPTDIYEFLWRWDFDPATRIREVTRIYTDLTDRPTLREMCSNPLVLSMYVAQDQTTGHPIAPESRTEFYSRVVEELIIRRRAVQVGVVEAQAIVREQRQKILGQVAYEHLRDPDQPANLLRWDRAVRVASDVTGLPFVEAEKHLRQISVDTGLITEEIKGETLRFIHLTFCEFLCAFEAIQGRSDGWSELINLHREFSSTSLRTRLVEVLPFACALMPRHMRVQAILALAPVADERVLALTFLETKQYDHEVWSRFITSLEHRLLSHDAEDLHSEWLSQVHLFMVVCADAERASKLLRGVANAERLLVFFTVLRKRDDGMIYRLIDSYAEQDAAAAFRVSAFCHIDILNELTLMIIRNCDQPPFLTLLLDLASREPERLPRWSCAFAEAGLRSPAVGDSLKRSPVTLWATQAEQVKRHHRWFGRGMAQRSTYTECVSVACSAVDTRGPFSLVSALSEIKGPGSDLSWRIAFSSILWLGIPLVVTLGMMGFFDSERMLYGPLHGDLLIGTIFIGIAECVTFLNFFIVGARLRVYHRLLSLTTDALTDVRSRSGGFLSRIAYFLSFATGRLPLYSRTMLRLIFFGRRRSDCILQFLQARRASLQLSGRQDQSLQSGNSFETPPRK
jgi:NACHT domain